MVPDSTFSRRSFLASGAALGSGLLGTGLLAPEWLPDSMTDTLLSVYPEPPGHVWRPDVSDAHADEAVALLEETVNQANTLRGRVDEESVSDDVARRLDRSPSGGWLDAAKDESDPRERLFDATYGMQFAGEAVGYAKTALDEDDPEALVERGEEIRTAADDVLGSLGEYPVSDPARDLAYLYFVERELAFARMNSHRSGTYTGDTASADEYSAHHIATTHGSHVQAEQRIRNARYYRDLYREQLGDDARPYADTLNDAVATLTDAVDEFPSRDEMWTTMNGEFTQETPYGAARWQLFWLCYDNDFRSGFDEDGYRPGHTVQRVVELSWAVLERRAHEFALAELDVSPDDTDYDSGKTFRQKQRAVKTFRSVRDEYSSPFAGVLAQEAADRIRAGDLGINSGDDDRPAWLNRVEAAATYLIGTGQMRELGDILRMTVDSG